MNSPEVSSFKRLKEKIKLCHFLDFYNLKNVRPERPYQ